MIFFDFWKKFLSFPFDRFFIVSKFWAWRNFVLVWMNFKLVIFSFWKFLGFWTFTFKFLKMGLNRKKTRFRNSHRNFNYNIYPSPIRVRIFSSILAEAKPTRSISCTWVRNGQIFYFKWKISIFDQSDLTRLSEQSPEQFLSKLDRSFAEFSPRLGFSKKRSSGHKLWAIIVKKIL